MFDPSFPDKNTGMPARLMNNISYGGASRVRSFGNISLMEYWVFSPTIFLIYGLFHKKKYVA